MSGRLLAAGALAAVLTGCQTTPVATVRTVVEICPSTLPEVGCPAWPPAATTLIELEEAHARGKAAHAQCAAALEAVEGAHAACAKAGE